jgi:hypothetical protein
MPYNPPPPPKTCQWLSGEPRERRWCGAEAVKGRSYCATHLALCFVTYKAQKETAA